MDTQDYAVELADIRFRWRNDRPMVLDIIDLTVSRGERLFIHGASGSGKSTLLSLLSGVNLPTEGQINVLGQSLGLLSAAQRDQFRADHIGFIFQMFNLIPYLSVLDNVMLPCLFSRQRRKRIAASGRSEADEAMRLLGHLEMADESILRSPVTELSVGQQQRVAAARALIGRPELIIADEPTSALDTDMRKRFIELLFRECDEAGSTLLFVSHDRELQSLFPRHLALQELNRVTPETAGEA